MLANAPSEEEMSSAKVRIVWTMVHNTEINELLAIIGKCHAVSLEPATPSASSKRLIDIAKSVYRLWPLRSGLLLLSGVSEVSDHNTHHSVGSIRP
jgi:hypothetical protein